MNAHVAGSCRQKLGRTAWLLVMLGAGSCGRPPVIDVLEGTYGGNCSGRIGNATAPLAAQCNERASCAYKIDVGSLGDPAVGCAKDFVARWSCDGRTISTIRVAPEASLGSAIQLKCG